jgi:hypothetical protein
LDYMFHGSCRRVSKVLSMGLEPISKSAVHYLAKRVSEIRVAREPRYRRCIAVDETKLRVKKSYVYIWSAVDVDSKELLALEASYGRSSLNALSFLKKVLCGLILPLWVLLLFVCSYLVCMFISVLYMYADSVQISIFAHLPVLAA